MQSGGAMNPAEGALFVVATPIGNLEDITLRALRVLREADVILAEDTRRIRKLLAAHGIPSPQVWSFFEGNEERKIPAVLALLQEGKRVALVSDAGTPTLSDPGFRLVRAAREAGVPVFPVPGPSAAVAALSVSGLPTDRFVFEGFLPRTRGKRRKRLEALADESRTVVLFASVHRIAKELQEMLEVLGDRRVFIAREMTKVHEEHFYGRLSEAVSWVAGKKGEFVVVLHGAG